MLQRCVALKIVVANRPVKHHLYSQTPLIRTPRARIKRAESGENVRTTFFAQGQGKLSVIVVSLPRTQTSLSRVQRKAGRRHRASPAVCTLPMVPCGSSPVARLYLAKNEAPEEEASGVRKAGFDCIAFFCHSCWRRHRRCLSSLIFKRGIMLILDRSLMF